jgi:predicted nucleotide-binding protein
MTELPDQLESIANGCDGIAARVERFADETAAIEHAAIELGKAWCGSWLGYHSRVYYDQLQPPPPGTRFDPTMGLMDRTSNRTVGDWTEYSFEELCNLLKSVAGQGVFAELEQLAKAARPEVLEQREKLLSVLNAIACNGEDGYIIRLLGDADAAKPVSASQFVQYYRPSGKFHSADIAAITHGLQTPPHIAILCEVQAIDSPFATAKRIASIARRATEHLENRRTAISRKALGGKNVFIGHGRSALWKDLKDFIQGRLDLTWDEFNRVPVAGITNIARLSQMLDSAAIAFLVMTAEDEHDDGKLHARMNVIHEAGLFQGRLGFERAIVLLEEGCEEFSNIQGLGQIRFPTGNISAVFENIRQVLEREGLVE